VLVDAVNIQDVAQELSSTPVHIAARLAEIPRFADRYIQSLHALVTILDSKPVNTLHMNPWSRFGGLSTQYYYQGRFELEPDEALIIETEIPDSVRYWGVGNFGRKGMDDMIRAQRLVDALKGDVDWSKIVDESFLADDLKSKK